MLKQRLIFGTIGAAIAIAVIVFCPVYVVGCILGLISLIGLGEFYNVTGILKKKSPVILLGFLFCILVFYGVIFRQYSVFAFASPAICTYIFLLMIFMVLFRDRISFVDSALSFFGTMYISVFFVHLLLICQLSMGKILIWILLICAWGTDTFAYFSGRLFGKHKLCPKISPKKTVEGAVGGTIGCAVLLCIYVAIIGNINNLTIDWLNVFVIAIPTAIFSQIGDLAASCIKRENNAKDYGNLIPGHGGILDRFDSVILISPLVYYLLLYFPVLG